MESRLSSLKNGETSCAVVTAPAGTAHSAAARSSGVVRYDLKNMGSLLLWQMVNMDGTDSI